MIHIQVLPPEEAKKIAAGEVVDRPAALVREFIDNAIDSGASSVELSIEGGGIRKVEVNDNGSGMSKEDLALCVKTHATSKIRSVDDLSRTTSLGFRGEALAAAAAVARLEILSAAETGEAWLLETGPLPAGTANPQSSPERISPGNRVRGTSVRAFGLFDAIPARKRFLKREGSEGALCRQIFIEKALAFPEISFRFVQDGRLKIHVLPQNKTILPREKTIPPQDKPVSPDTETGYRARFAALVPAANESQFLHELHAAGNGFSVTVVFGGPELFRHDRRQQYVFANRRRIQDYGLMQALEYGLAGFFPNGSHPVGAVFVDVDPALADFNIHPAKREVRFADPGAIHHAVTSTLVNYVRNAAGRFHAPGRDSPPGEPVPELRFPADRPVDRPGGYGERSGRLAMEALLERKDEFGALLRRSGPDWSKLGMDADFAETGTASAGEAAAAYAAAELGTAYSETDGRRDGTLHLVGRVFGLFIIVEKGDRIFIIDQHAAHERILYERFLSKP
ncbi:MAG: DNA mismatch repair endonuclease MutL, partial [Treponema sp.]|nr:DNA mismatch repair endonuclease MutL [Treponema sp.]